MAGREHSPHGRSGVPVKHGGSATAKKAGEKSTDSTSSKQGRNVSWSGNIMERRDFIDDEQDDGQAASGPQTGDRVSQQKVFSEAAWKKKEIEGRQQTRLEMLENFFEKYKQLLYEHRIKIVDKRKVHVYQPKKKCVFDENCKAASKFALPTIEGSPRGMKRLDLLYAILKALEQHYGEYHKPSEGLEPKMIKEITDKIYDVLAERIELKDQLEKEARAREEERMERELELQLSGRPAPVLTQRMAKSSSKPTKR